MLNRFSAIALLSIATSLGETGTTLPQLDDRARTGPAADLKPVTLTVVESENGPAGHQFLVPILVQRSRRFASAQQELATGRIALRNSRHPGPARVPADGRCRMERHQGRNGRISRIRGPVERRRSPSCCQARARSDGSRDRSRCRHEAADRGSNREPIRGWRPS